MQATAYATFQRLWRPYLGTSCAVSASMLIGDYVCQRLEMQQQHQQHKLARQKSAQFQTDDNSLWAILKLDEIDTRRSYAMFVTGFFVSSVFGHTQQRIMEHYIPGNTMRAIAAKMSINCAVAPVNIGLSFASIIYFRGGSNEQIKQKLSNDITSTWAAGIMYWPIISFINFRYVHLDYRAALGSLAGAVWNVYISKQANKPDKQNVDVPAAPPLAVT